MSELIMRAEQGVLGALLADLDQPAVLESLTGDDFGHPVHKDIYLTLSGLHQSGHDSNLEPVTAAVARQLARPTVDAEWLQQLADNAPNHELAEQYAQIVVQAAFDRDTAAFGDLYLDAAELSTDPAARQRLTRLHEALDTQAAIFAVHTSIDGDLDPHLGSVNAAEGVAMHREDQIIADLIQHPEHIHTVAPWLDPAVFTTEQRRLTYETAVTYTIADTAIDDVVLAWHIQRSREINTMDERDIGLPNARNETDHSYLHRLKGTTIKAGTAIIVGRELLTEHVQSTLALSATAAAERTQNPTIHTTIQARLEPPLTAQQNIEPRHLEL